MPVQLGLSHGTWHAIAQALKSYLSALFPVYPVFTPQARAVRADTLIEVLLQNCHSCYL